MLPFTQTQFGYDGSRRAWLFGTAALGALFGAAGMGRLAGAAEKPSPIVQPSAATPPAFTGRAFDMKRQAEQSGDQPYGAVVVQAGRIVGQAPSRVVARRDPTAHAEMEAIRDATQRLGTRSLNGCILYSSFQPCPMCEAAAYWAGIERLVHGSESTDIGPPRLHRC